jgi:hypothetical protein
LPASDRGSRPLDGGEIDVDGGEYAADGETEGRNRPDTHDGDQADEHPVLDEGRALVVLGKTSDQFTHEKKILFRVDEDDWLSIACPVAGIGVTRLDPKTKKYILNERTMLVKDEILK